MSNALDLVSANEMFDVTATTSPRSGNVMNDVVPPSNVRLAWLASRVGSPASGNVSIVHPRPY
jgi:hypothetical protein